MNYAPCDWQRNMIIAMYKYMSHLNNRIPVNLRMMFLKIQ